jgi:hypothetical protein
MILWAARLATIWFHDSALFGITFGMWTIVGLFAAAGALRFATYAKLVDTEHVYRSGFRNNKRLFVRSQIDARLTTFDK